MSSCWLPGLSAQTSFAIDTAAALHGSSRWRRSVSMRLSSPKSSPRLFTASVMPSV